MQLLAQKLKKSYIENLKKEVSPIDLTWIRVWVYTIILWKLLSRDFSYIALMDSSLLEFYPIFHYQADLYHLTGFKFIVDILTFHWIHWFIHFPTITILKNIQITLIILSLIIIFFGSGYKNMNAIIFYILAMYLWGFMYRTSSDFDGSQILLQICLLFCFKKHKDYSLISFYYKKKVRNNRYNSSIFFNLIIGIFGFYYFCSGLHKFYDLNIIQWFMFDFTKIVKYYIELENSGNFRKIYEIFYYIPESSFLDNILAPIAYCSHLIAFLIILNRKYIKHFALFYIIFHLLNFSIGIAFTGLMLAWLIFLPISRFIETFKKLMGIKLINNV